MKNIILTVGLLASAAAFAQHDIGVYCGAGAEGIGAYRWFTIVDECPQTKLHLVDDEDIRAGALDKLDMLIMPGGWSGKQYHALKDEGMEKIRSFLRNGGGYMGTCAGCFLLIDQDNVETDGKRLHIAPYRYVDAPKGAVYLNHNFSEAGKAGLGITNDNWVIRFYGGPVMVPSMNEIKDANFESWAKFSSDADMRKPITDANRTSGYDAIIGGTYGKGRAVAFAGHPEYFAGTAALVDGAMRWILQDQSVKTVRHYRKLGAKSVALVSMSFGTKDIASSVVKLNACTDYDIFPVDPNTIWMNELEHVDLVLFMSGKPRFSKPQAAAIFEGYMQSGGRAIVHEPGADILQEVAAAFAIPAAK